MPPPHGFGDFVGVSDIRDRRERGGGVVRVPTHNIYARRSNQEGWRRILDSGISALRPDHVALQETVLTGDFDQIGDFFGAEYHIVHSRRV